MNYHLLEILDALKDFKQISDLDLDYLKQSLNPLTEYKLGIIPDMQSTAEEWNIK
ncbi:MAG: hypothetical protein ABIJ59_15185 [Pseudomonadota bacterium]